MPPSSGAPAGWGFESPFPAFSDLAGFSGFSFSALPPCLRRPLVEGQDDLADLHLVALLDLDLLHRARHVRRHLDGRLVGLELEHRLILLERIARVDHDADDVTGGDVLAEFRNLEFGRHIVDSQR
jgi:hypothetical protein